jgi:penicillin-binding protein-related factor A (putative recombinase)
MKETDIVNSILENLRVHYPKCYFWKQGNYGAFRGYNKQGEKRFSFAGEKGVSDILGISPDGRFCAIEVKTPETFKKEAHNASNNQLKFLQEIDKRKGLAMIVCCFEQVEIILKANNYETSL